MAEVIRPAFQAGNHMLGVKGGTASFLPRAGSNAPPLEEITWNPKALRSDENGCNE